MQFVDLNDGNKIPNIGLGTWDLHEPGLISEALKIGYRLIDTAKIYGNEPEVGQGILQSSLSREEIFVTTKLWNSDHGYNAALTAIDDSLQKLGLDYVDLYLIHWPSGGKLQESWEALVEIQKQGKTKSIGVSNYSVDLLDEMLNYSSIPPAVNQIEFHPSIYERQKPTLDFCKAHNIIIEAYSPLAQASDLNNIVIREIADRVGKTPAQIMLRWALQHGTVPIPKTSHPERLKENLAVLDFELSRSQVEKLNNLSL